MLKMDHLKEIQLNVTGAVSAQGSLSPKDPTASNYRLPSNPTPTNPIFQQSWKWWLMVAVEVVWVLAGQTVATLLGRLYFNEGGNSKWTATLVQSAGAPLLLVPLCLSRYFTKASPLARPPLHKLAIVYISIGLLIGGDNLMYSYGLLYLPVSTYSLICATQLAFNAIFSYFLNSQKFTILIFNSVVLLTFSAALLGVGSDSSGSPGEKYAVGFVVTLGASGTFSLILSLMQLSFEKVIKMETYLVVLEMQMCTNVVAAVVSVVGLFGSGEWRTLGQEMDNYQKGKVSYLMTLIWTAIGWQVSSVGMLGLIFAVSSLFSNVVSTVALPLVPIFAVIFFHDKMDGVKVVAMLIAVWGFLSYIYQHYLDDLRAKKLAKKSSGRATNGSVTSP
ncbi:putative purine permease 11 [Ananas comosus]|uniref:Probable purine permease n=1 Tax=Ananas comosus TaxID=4615 RepID=A0A199UMG9_ANACO|nr:putative purine permease 11 [Ananas comosus]